MKFTSTVFVLLFISLSVSLFAQEPKPWPENAFLPVTEDRINSLPDAERQEWIAYWEKSNAILKTMGQLDLVDHSTLVPNNDHPGGGKYSMGLRLDAPYTWYANEAARTIADYIVKWQVPQTGGWTKAGVYSRDRGPDDYRGSGWDCGTFDNNSTIYELMQLAKVISHDNRVPSERLNPWKESFYKGLQYIFNAQYPNGGFPQIYPLVGEYHDAITLNDDAYVHILELFRDISNGVPVYAFVPDEMRGEARWRFEKGLKCLLAMQLRDSIGNPTIWGAQHDAITLKPCAARNFEPISACALESVGAVRFLMTLPKPSPEIVASVDGAMNWFDDTVIKDTYWDRNAASGVGLESKPGAPDMWARFYEIETRKPIYGDRDRRTYYSIAELGFERRKGYTWLVPDPSDLGPLYIYWQVNTAKTKKLK